MTYHLCFRALYAQQGKDLLQLCLQARAPSCICTSLVHSTITEIDRKYTADMDDLAAPSRYAACLRYSLHDQQQCREICREVLFDGWRRCILEWT